MARRFSPLGPNPHELATPQAYPKLHALLTELMGNARKIAPDLAQPTLSIPKTWPYHPGQDVVYSAEDQRIYMKKSFFEDMKKDRFKDLRFDLAHELGHHILKHARPPRGTATACIPKKQEIEADLLGAQISGDPAGMKALYEKRAADKRRNFGEDDEYPSMRTRAQAIGIMQGGKEVELTFDKDCGVVGVAPGEAPFSIQAPLKARQDFFKP